MNNSMNKATHYSCMNHVYVCNGDSHMGVVYLLVGVVYLLVGVVNLFDSKLLLAKPAKGFAISKLHIFHYINIIINIIIITKYY